MQITLSKYAGFCDGVDRAYKIVEKIAKDKKVKRPVFVLGSLVHNEDVVRRVDEMGIKKIKDDFDLKKPGNILRRKIGTVVITAHGVGPEVYDFFRRKNIDVIDATCPRVIKVQRLAKIFFQKDYQIVIIGEKDHKEIKGIYAWAGQKAFFVEEEKDLKNIKLDPRKKIAIISQTTQNQDFIKHASGVIKKKYPQAETVDTLCLATHNRQDEVKKLAQKNDVLLVIGSLTSANSKRLAEIGKKENPKTYFIENAKNIKKAWFANCKKIGVTAGASTPQWIIKDVFGFLREL